MAIVRRFKVTQAFPIWRRKEDMKPGEVFDVEKGEMGDEWDVIDGRFFMVNLPRHEIPDFTGARLAYLIKHKFLEGI